jgi:hypothetical protein
MDGIDEGGRDANSGEGLEDLSVVKLVKRLFNVQEGDIEPAFALSRPVTEEEKEVSLEVGVAVGHEAPLFTGDIGDEVSDLHVQYLEEQS